MTVRISMLSFLDIAKQLYGVCGTTLSLCDLYTAGKTLIHAVLESDRAAVEAAVKTNSTLQRCTIVSTLTI